MGGRERGRRKERGEGRERGERGGKEGGREGEGEKKGTRGGEGERKESIMSLSQKTEPYFLVILISWSEHLMLPMKRLPCLAARKQVAVVRSYHRPPLHTRVDNYYCEGNELPRESNYV